MNELMRRLLNLPEQASTFARDVDWLHYALITVTMVGSSAVFLVALWLVIRYRQRPGRSLVTAYWTGPFWLEGGLILLVLSLFVSAWIVGFKQYLRMEEPPPGALDVYVTGKQWMWKFAYPGGPGSVGVLYVPAHRPVRLLLTSRDVIHSFYVPAFRVKKDAVPGRYTVAWFEATQVGRFPVRCAEFCGAEHSMMLATVEVLAPEEFERWLAQPTVGVAPPPTGAPGAPAVEDADERLGVLPRLEPAPDLAQRGRDAAVRYGCLKCHTVDGSPHVGPTWLGLYGREEELAGGGRVRVDEAYITESMMDPLARIAAGFQPVMPSFFGRIEPPETAAIVEYIKSLQPQRRAPSLDERTREPAGALP